MGDLEKLGQGHRGHYVIFLHPHLTQDKCVSGSPKLVKVAGCLVQGMTARDIPIAICPIIPSIQLSTLSNNGPATIDPMQPETAPLAIIYEIWCILLLESISKSSNVGPSRPLDMPYREMYDYDTILCIWDNHSWTMFTIISILTLVMLDL